MIQKLLLADDSMTIQRVIELTFSGEDVDVVTVGDGEEAIARIQSEKPDIVLADIGMPKRSGYEVAAFVKAHPDLSHIPVLLLAGAFEPVDEARATEVKCDGVLVKPFEPQHVISRVRELLDRGKATVAALPARDWGRETRESISAPRPEPPGEPRAVPPPEIAPGAPSGPLVPDTAAAADPALDDYFNRLDAAFATLGNTATPLPDNAMAADSIETFGGRGVPTIDDVLAGASLRTPPAAPASPFGRVSPPSLEPPETAPTLAPAARPPAVAQSGDRSGIADVFSLLFAIEQGEADPATIRISPPGASAPVTDELVDQITRCVLERLAPGMARAVVADVVSEVAERLVREEIDRIRKATADHKPQSPNPKSQDEAQTPRNPTF